MGKQPDARALRDGRFPAATGGIPHRDALTLKGGNLFVVWLGGVGYRPTLDTDFLCRGDASPRHLAEMFRDIAAIAEKLHAMVEHGEVNSRMKDFYDVWFLASHFAFEWATLRTALEKSLSRRGVWPLPEVPLALAPGFADAPPRLSLWSGFVRRTRLQDSAPTFPGGRGGHPGLSPARPLPAHPRAKGLDSGKRVDFLKQPIPSPSYPSFFP